MSNFTFQAEFLCVSFKIGRTLRKLRKYYVLSQSFLLVTSAEKGGVRSFTSLPFGMKMNGDMTIIKMERR
jgi:hypothetical protein